MVVKLPHKSSHRSMTVTRAATICLFLTALLCRPIQAKLPLNFQHVLELSDPSAFKALEGLKMLYYFVDIRDSGYDFFYEYDKAANFLSQYGFRAGIVDCSSVTDPDCQEPSIGTKIFLYQNDEIWASLYLMNMFDVNSIASNALQIALIDVVDIINTKVERLERMAPLQGKKDVVFGYFSAIGTYVHRVFMEVAYAFHNEVQFMFTNSQRAVSDLEMSTTDNNTIIWFFKCKGMPSDPEERAVGNCPRILYRGNVTLNSLLWALRLLDGPKHFYLPEDGSRIPCQAVHCIYLYYDEQKKEKMIEVADLIVNTYQGVMATVLVNLKSKEVADLFLLSEDLPSISVTYAGEEDHYHFKKNISKESLFEFIEETLSNAPNTSDSDSEFALEDMEAMDHASFLIDDEVAASLFESRHLNIDVSSLTALTDKTFAEAETSPNLTLVLFYKSCDPASVTLLQHLSEWRDQNKDQFPDLALASVNCFDWTDVCSKQMILLSPTVRLIGHQRGQDIKTDPERTYTGALNPKDVVSYLFIYGLDGVMKISAEDANQLLSGEFRGISNLTSHCLFGLFHEHSWEMAEFELAAKEQRGKTLYTLMTGPDAESFGQTHGLTLPTVLALRWDDPLVPKSSMSGPINKGKILEFSKSSKISLFPELTPEVLPYIYQTKRPLLILFWKSPDPSYSTMKDLVESGEFKDIIFTWLNLTSYTDFGVQLVETYFSVPSLPALSMIYFTEKLVYNFEGNQITEESVKTWIEKLINHRDSMEPSYQMKHNEWKPQRESYDFLKDHPFDHWENVKTTLKKPDVSTSVPENAKKPAHEEL